MYLLPESLILIGSILSKIGNYIEEV